MSDSRNNSRVSRFGTPCDRWQGWIIRPDRRLRASVRSLWYVRGRGESVQARIPTDGCVSIGFNLGDPTRVWRPDPGSGAVQQLAAVWVEGLQRTFLDTATDDCTEILGCRLTPAGALRLFGSELPHLSDHVVPDTNVGALPFRTLLARLLETPSVTARCQMLHRFLEYHLDRSQAPDYRITYALDRLSSPASDRSVSCVAGDVGLSASRFTHWFRERLGVTPKQFSSIHRFRFACADIASSDRIDWSDLAAKRGYCDQSHLIREFQAKLGMTPADYHRRLDNLSQSVAVL